MTRVLAIHNTSMALANPWTGDSLHSLAREIEYKKGLDYYGIITRTKASEPKKSHSPVENMDLIATNSKTRYHFMWEAYSIACRIIEEKKIDVITGWGWCWVGLILLALRKKYKTPMNTQIHWEFINNPYFKREKLEYRLWDTVGRFAVPRADTYFVGTSKQKNDLIKYGIESERIFYIPYTILTDKFEIGEPESIKNQLKEKGFENMLLFVGRLVKQKDVHTLLRAAKVVFKQKPNTALALLGKGPEDKAIKRTISKLQIEKNIIMPGHMSQQECINYYHASDVVCLSSLYEGTCRVYLEAMAASKPVVTTDVAGAFDAVIEEKTGYIVKKKDSKDFADKVLSILDNPIMAKNMGREGKILLKKDFTMQRHYDGFVHMWNETKRLGIKDN